MQIDKWRREGGEEEGGEKVRRREGRIRWRKRRKMEENEG